MSITGKYLPGNVLPTVVVVSVVMLTAMLGLFMLWEHETLLFARTCRLRQARADVESAYTLYRLHPKAEALTTPEGYLLYDSLPLSRVHINVQPWGLYEAVRITTADSLLCVCRLSGAEPDAQNTLVYADSRSAVTLAGRAELRGMLRLPRNGLIYGRVGAEFFCGAPISEACVRVSDEHLEQPLPAVGRRIEALFNRPEYAAGEIPDSLFSSFLQDTILRFWLGDARIGNCSLRGRIILYADELHVDPSCRMEHLLICARKVIVGERAQITAQIFARDTVIVEKGALLAYPSGIYAQAYVRIGDGAEVNGYVIIRDTVRRKKITANYQQSRTARVRGLVWVDGTAQVQGIVSGRLCLRQSAYFSPQGYYKDLFYDMTLLENPHTAHPLWLADTERRKEAVCVN